jgi:hypothetical protein
MIPKVNQVKFTGLNKINTGSGKLIAGLFSMKERKRGNKNNKIPKIKTVKISSVFL